MDIISVEEARSLNPVTLAFLGDGYYELLVRQKIIAESGSRKARELHNTAVGYVRAGFQSSAVELILPLLSEAEEEIYRRGRNCNGNTVPRSSNPREYRRATGLEALFGFLSLTGKQERAEELFEVIFNVSIEKKENKSESGKTGAEKARQTR